MVPTLVVRTLVALPEDPSSWVAAEGDGFPVSTLPLGVATPGEDR